MWWSHWAHPALLGWGKSSKGRCSRHVAHAFVRLWCIKWRQTHWLQGPHQEGNICFTRLGHIKHGNTLGAQRWWQVYRMLCLIRAIEHGEMCLSQWPHWVYHVFCSIRVHRVWGDILIMKIMSSTSQALPNCKHCIKNVAYFERLRHIECKETYWLWRSCCVYCTLCLIIMHRVWGDMLAMKIVLSTLYSLPIWGTSHEKTCLL